MPDIPRDLRDAFQSARRQPGLSLVIILTLAVGIGASTAIFTYLIESYWIRLGGPDGHRIYSVATGMEGRPGSYPISYPDTQIYSEALEGLGDLAPRAFPHGLTITIPGQDGKTLVGLVATVSKNHFDFFGAQFVQGRDFLPAEHRRDGPSVAVIDHTFWRRHMGADTEVLGRPLRLNGHTFTIVGVTPQGFENDGWPQAVYVPTARYDDLLRASILDNREARRFACLLRLHQGVQPEEAEARLAVVAKSLDQENPWPGGAERHVTLSPNEFLNLDLTTADRMMAGAVGLLLLLACANVANLLLVRAAGRQREIAVLSALGAGRGRIVRRLLTEGGLLALAGGSLGLLLARWLLAIIRLYYERAEFGYTYYYEGNEWIRYDDRVLGFTLLVALGTGFLFSLAPIIHSTRIDLVSALKSGSGTDRPGQGFGTLNFLVVTQVALATTLLLSAGLLMRNLQGLENRALGFETEHQLMAALTAVIPPSDDSEAQQREVWRSLYESGRQRLAELPSVESATLVSVVPGTGYRRVGRVVLPKQPAENFQVNLLQVGPDFFKTFGISLVGGRPFDTRDRAGALGAAIVNQAFVDRFFADVEPIDQELAWANLETDAVGGRFRVVGVAPNIRHDSRLVEPAPLVYLPISQYLQSRFRARLEAVVRTTGPPQALIPSARQALSNVHSDLAVTELGTYGDITNDVQDPEFHSVLSGLFSLFGLFLACLGIYGVTTYSVSNRLRELGIRTALGATGRDLVRLVLGKATRLTVMGITLGVVLTFASAKFISSILYGISPTDPLTPCDGTSYGRRSWLPSRLQTRLASRFCRPRCGATGRVEESFG